MRKSLMATAVAVALSATPPAQAAMPSDPNDARWSGTASAQLQKPGVRLERIRSRRSRRAVTLRVRGQLLAPAGVAPEQACTGSVAITVRRGGRSLATGGTRLRANCRFSRRMSIPRRHLGRARVLKVRAAFSGNAVLFAARRTRAVRIRR